MDGMQGIDGADGTDGLDGMDGGGKKIRVLSDREGHGH